MIGVQVLDYNTISKQHMGSAILNIKGSQFLRISTGLFSIGCVQVSKIQKHETCGFPSYTMAGQAVLHCAVHAPCGSDLTV